jgi:hypothetical protein
MSLGVVLGTAIAVGALGVSYRLRETQAWWVGAALIYAFAAYVLVQRRPDDERLANFNNFFAAAGAFVIALNATAVLGITHLMRISPRRLAGTRSSAPADHRTPAPRHSSDT